MEPQISIGHRSSLNPYRRAASLVIRRLLWDINPKSWIARRKLRGIKDSHVGEKAVILCNGPSLNLVDFQLLKTKGVYTFGLNKINLLFDRTDFRPKSIVCVNRLVVDQNIDFYNATDIPLFVDSVARNKIVYRCNIFYLHSMHVKQEFATDVSVSICQGNTVTYVALQIAYHMGFSQVALVGCDHNFAVKGIPNTVALADGKDVNHFDERYFSAGAAWQLPDILSSEVHYELAKTVFEAQGRKLVNCTEGGKLEILPRMDIEQFLGS